MDILQTQGTKHISPLPTGRGRGERLAGGENILIVILGPTGVGKTELCLTVAQHFGCDIINCDSRQLFREIPIGTAAPTAEQQQLVRHHFVGTLSLTDYYSASEYEQDVLALITKNGNEKRNENENEKTYLSPPYGEGQGGEAGMGEAGMGESAEGQAGLFILSGGSMMYIDAVCNGIDDIPTVRDDIREEMKHRLKDEGLEALDAELQQLDPIHWSTVDHNNPRRILHALEICHQTGLPYSSFLTKTRKPRPFRTIKIGLTRPREELYERINHRVLDMIGNGMIDEARKVYPLRHLNSLNTVGYKELFSYFDGNIDLQEAIRQIQSNTRRYMRKQETWFKRDKEIKWFHPSDVKQIINYLDETLCIDEK